MKTKIYSNDEHMILSFGDELVHWIKKVHERKTFNSKGSVTNDQYNTGRHSDNTFVNFNTNERLERNATMW